MSSTKEYDFRSVSKSLKETFESYKDGCGSINDIVEHVEFQSRLTRMTRKFNYEAFCGEKDGDDVRQEVSMRLCEEGVDAKLWLPGNVETLNHFLNWTFVLTRNHYYDLIRRRLAKQRDGMRDDNPPEEYEFPFLDDLSENDADRELREAREDAALDGFPTFIKRYSLPRQLAIRRWFRRNKSYRRIQKLLQRLGYQTTYVTIGNWLNATIEDYSRYLNEPPESRRQTGT